MQARFDLPDTLNDRLRVLISTINAELERSGGPAAGDPLRLAWDELNVLLAMEPLAEARACSACGRMSRIAATRCVYCWNALHPQK